MRQALVGAYIFVLFLVLGELYDLGVTLLLYSVNKCCNVQLTSFIKVMHADLKSAMNIGVILSWFPTIISI